MNIKILKKQISKGEYELVKINIDNQAEVEALRLHNKEVNHKIYEEKKLYSKYSLETFQEKYNYEFPDENSDPLEKLIKEKEGDYEALKEEKLNQALPLLGQALSKLTDRQNTIVIAIVVDKKSLRQVANELNIDFKTVDESYKAGMKKLKKFFIKLPDYTKYFPNLNK